MSYFVIGCTHFGHANIIKFASRPFKTVEEMDEILIENWNRAVKAKDTVYHLGDFAFKNHEKYLRSLNGSIVKIQGNHDPHDWGDDYMEVQYQKRKFVLFHYPIHEWNGFFRGAVHLHAHTHTHEFMTGENRFCCGAEAVGYTPKSLDSFIQEK